MDDIEEWEDYYQFYYIGSVDNFTTHLARQLLSDLSNKYLGFDLINDFYDIEKKIILAYGDIAENQLILKIQKKIFSEILILELTSI